MSKIIFDIETTSLDYQNVDDLTKEKLEKEAKELSLTTNRPFEEVLQEKKDELGFSPATGIIVALGMYDPDNKKGAVYYQSAKDEVDCEENGIKLVKLGEREMLLKFWEILRMTDELIGFNSRMFDAPYIMMRSAINGIRPNKDLMSNRYISSQKYDLRHVDLFDQLSFYGATRYKGSLHLWCNAFGIKSPKENHIDGSAVHSMYRNGECLEIAKYNSRDLLATASLYEYWNKYLRF